MEIIITIASILTFTGMAWLFRRLLKINLCPICAGVSLTWIWMLLGMTMGLLPTTHYELLTGILMGGSIVWIAYTLEKNLSVDPLKFKAIFIPVGFIAAFSLINFNRAFFALSAISLILIAFFATRRVDRDVDDRKVMELEDKMKNCC